MEIMDHRHTLKLEGTGIKELHPSIENLSGLKWLYLNHCQNFELLPSSIWSLQSLEDLFLSDCPKLTRVPPLTKLRNFPSLHLEENSLLSTLRVPHQLFSISSLDLQGSNIESIPANIKELPQLYTLNLRSCQRLTSLPELPLSLIKMVAQDCISLRTVSTSWCSATPEKWITNANYYYTNCFNLSENAQSNIVRNFLRRTKYISASSFEDGVFHSFKFHHGFYSLPVLESSIPGSEVPEFFRYQSRGSSLTAHLPANWYNSKFMGFAMCAVVEFKSSYSDSDFIDHLNHNADSQKHISSFLVLCHFTSYDHSARSDHILMGYDPFLARGIEGDDWLDKSKVAFKFNIFEGIGPPSPPYQVKKCGVGLIYDQDKEYLIANKRSYDKYFGGHGGETSENRRQKWKFR